jgi:DNA repair protein RecN (Recombination protein N)
MLRHLDISEFGLIEKLELAFAPGFVCLTGETGAGKSMLVDGVMAVFGSRLDNDRIRAGAKAARVSLLFELTSAQINSLSAIGVETNGGELLLLRELPADGRSRIWANGASISFALARQIGDRLLENIGQHEGQALLDPTRHLAFLDEAGSLLPLHDEYTRALLQWRQAEALWKNQMENQAARLREMDNLNRELAEIEAAGVKPGEDVQLRERRQILRSHGTLMEELSRAISALREEEGAQSRVAEAYHALEAAGGIDPKLSGNLANLSEIVEMLNDLSRELADYAENLVFLPGELEDVEERLNLLERLGKRFGNSADAILAYAAQARTRLEQLEAGAGSLEELEQDLEEKRRKLEVIATELHEKRMQQSRRLEEAMQQELANLAMDKARFTSQPTLREDANGQCKIGGKQVSCVEDGADVLEFLFSANPGEPLRPLSKVASGGELSRLMLALKTITAQVGSASTLIFDEVDSGIGGNTAHVLGERLRRLSRANQVLVVTHLPQIAARADSQIALVKEESGGRTLINACTLSEKERLQEIARMLGGGQPPTAVTLNLADELLNLNRQP